MRTLQQLQEDMKKCLEEQALVLAEYEMMKAWLRSHDFIGVFDKNGRLYWRDNGQPMVQETSPLKLPD